MTETTDYVDSYLASAGSSDGQDVGQGDIDFLFLASNVVAADGYARNAQDEELVGSYKQQFIEDANDGSTSCKDTISIDDLPNEILVHILSFLEIKERIQSELVCKRWRALSTQLPWTYPNKLVFVRHAKKSSFQMAISDLTDSIVLAILTRCGPALRQLIMTSEQKDTVTITWKSIAIVGQYCPNLEALKLYIPVNSLSLTSIANGCPKLKVAKIFNFGDSDHDEGVLAIIKKCRSLECLAVSDLFMADEWFKGINPKLKTLRMHKCTLMPSAMRNLMQECDSLRELDLGFLLHMGVDETILFEIFAHFKKTLKVLEVMCIGVREYVNWRQGLKVLHNLEELCLNHCLSVEDDAMVVLADECPNLRVLAVAGTNVTDAGLVHLQRLPNFKVLDISLINRRVCGDGLKVLAKRGILEEVYMQSMAEVTEENCCCLAKLCPNLRVFDLSGTKQITNRLVKAFCAAIKLGFLKERVKLVVGHTSVKRKVRVCEGLDLIFSEYRRGM